MNVTAKRTQVYLPADLHEQALRYAKRQRLSLAGVIRAALIQTLHRSGKQTHRCYDHDPLWKVIGAAKSKDGDLSARHDAYLYGRPHPERV